MLPQINQRFKQKLPKPPFKNVKQGFGPAATQGMGPARKGGGPKILGAGIRAAGKKKPPKKPGAGKPGLPGLPGQPPVPMLDDSIYQGKMNVLNTGLANQQLALQQQESQLRSSFGFDPQYADNPYTRANVLMRRAQQREAGTLNTLAGGGQLYSGAFNRARAADVLTSGAELDEARREFAQALAGVEGERLGAQSEYASSAADAYADLLGRFEERDPDPTLFSDGMGGGKGGKGGKGGRGKGKGGGKKPPVDPGFQRPVRPPKKQKPRAKGGIRAVAPTTSSISTINSSLYKPRKKK